MSFILGSPLVKVPVLSKTILSILVAFNIALPSLIKIFFFAKLPIVTTRHTGMDNPIAQGQEIKRTHIALFTLPPNMYVTMAIKITVGTNICYLICKICYGRFNFTC